MYCSTLIDATTPQCIDLKSLPCQHVNVWLLSLDATVATPGSNIG